MPPIKLPYGLHPNKQAAEQSGNILTKPDSHALEEAEGEELTATSSDSSSPWRSAASSIVPVIGKAARPIAKDRSSTSNSTSASSTAANSFTIPALPVQAEQQLQQKESSIYEAAAQLLDTIKRDINNRDPYNPRIISPLAPDRTIRPQQQHLQQPKQSLAMSASRDSSLLKLKSSIPSKDSVSTATRDTAPAMLAVQKLVQEAGQKPAVTSDTKADSGTAAVTRHDAPASQHHLHRHHQQQETSPDVSLKQPVHKQQQQLQQQRQQVLEEKSSAVLDQLKQIEKDLQVPETAAATAVTNLALSPSTPQQHQQLQPTSKAVTAFPGAPSQAAAAAAADATAEPVRGPLLSAIQQPAQEVVVTSPTAMSAAAQTALTPASPATVGPAAMKSTQQQQQQQQQMKKEATPTGGNASGATPSKRPAVPIAAATPPAGPKQQQQQQHQETYSMMSNVSAKYWDQQIAQGRLSMCSIKYPTYINIMLYGESGLGKTTCIRNLTGSWKIRRQGSAFPTPSKTSLEQFKRDPSTMRVELEPITDDTSNLEMHYSFQDMPGWGDDINLVNSLKTVIHFILKQRQKDYIASKAGQTEFCAVPGTMMRHGITVCLYFVPTHRVKPIDWIMMAAISKLVAVIPVIAKADTYTEQEMEDFRQELLRVIHHTTAITRTTTPIQPTPFGTATMQPPPAVFNRTAPVAAGKGGVRGENTLGSDGLGGQVVALPISSSELGDGDIKERRANIRSSSPCGQSDHANLAKELCLETYSFRQSDLHMVGASDAKLPPFSIVSSNNLMTADDVDSLGLEDGDIGLPFRRYRWGTAFPLSRDHSDLVILKQLLFGHRNFAVHDLLQDSWRRAYGFAKQYQVLLIKHHQQQNKAVALGAANGSGSGGIPAWLAATQLSAGADEETISLQPLVEELCSSTTGESNSQLIDKLRTEEAKRMQTDLKKAKAELERRAAGEKQLHSQLSHMQAESEALRQKVRQQSEVIERLQREMEGLKANNSGSFSMKQGKNKSKFFR